MSKNQQKNTFNDASGLLNSTEGSTAATLGTSTAEGSAASNSYAALNPSNINSMLAPGTNAASGINATGGYAQPQLNTLENAEASNLGGLDPTALSSLSGQYQDLISSGGISDATQAAMQRQAVSGVSSLYGTLNQQQQRNRAVTGGQGGGGETAEMARQLGSSEANAITGVNADVGQLRQQGTEAGLSGASNLLSAQAQAQNAAANTFSGTQGGVASGVQTGAGLLSGLSEANVNANLGVAAGQTGLYNATNNLYGTQLGAEQGYLNSMSGIANAEQGPLGNVLSIGNMLGNMAGGAGKLISGIGSLGGSG